MRIRIFVLCLLLIFSLATGASAEKYAGEFMALGGGARAMSMGGAFIAVANDATTTYWNPAGIADFSSFLTTPGSWEMSLMHSERFGELIDYNYFSSAFPLKNGKSGWGVSLIHMGIDDIRIVPMNDGMIDNSDGDDRFEPWNGESLNFDYRNYPLESVNDLAVFLSYGQMMSWGDVGATLKFIRNDQVTGVSSFGLGVDLGYLKRGLWRDLAVGVKLQDATGTFISWSTGKREFIYPAVKLGLAWPITIKSMNSVLVLAADSDFRFENRKWVSQYWIGSASADFHFGMELLIRNLVALRGGNDMGRWTAGAGFLLKDFTSWEFNLGIDYALLMHDFLDTTHRVSLLVSF
ncbi:MAG: PorV/PorQ family protein [Candidatus Krumholzibacteria bacterium]|nr:PorV/PorQ family protein [Candidatus Krumholzibacteria bacterium]